MRIFGIPIIVSFEPDMELELQMEDVDQQDQVDYVNSWIQTGGYEEYEAFEQGVNLPPKQHWWQRI